MLKNNLKKIVVLFLLVSTFFSACRAGDGIPPTPTETALILEEPESQPTVELIAPTTEPSIVMEDIYQNTDPNGQVITFWHPYSGDRERALLEVIEEFNLSNAWDITVVADYQGSYDDIFDKMLTFMHTEEVPNLVVAYPHQSATYYLGKGLVDLNELVYSTSWGLSGEEKGDFIPGFFEQDVFSNFDDIRLGFPIQGSMELLYYNADWLRELGRDAPPTTPAEFKELACAATNQPYSNATAGGSIGYPLRVDATNFTSWSFAFGGYLFDEESNQFIFDAPETVTAMQFIQDLVNEGCADLITERNGDQIEFNQGTALFSLASSSELPFYQRGVAEGASHNWSVATVSHTTASPVQNIQGVSVSISKTSPEAQLASWLFLKFFTSPEIQARWAMATDSFPVRASASAGMGDYFADHPAYATAFALLPSGIAEPPLSGYKSVRDRVAESMYAISLGAEVGNELTTLNAETNAYLEEQLAIVPETPDPWAEIDPSGQTVIFWHQQPPARHTALDEIIWGFNSTNKWGITVVAEYQQDISQKMQTVINTAQAPNLVEIFQSQAAEYQLSGALVDMTPLVESIKWGFSPQDQGDFFPGIYFQDIYPHFNNARLGFPIHRSMEVVYYNADWLAELRAGEAIDFDGPPQTPEQFQAAACAAVSNPYSDSLVDTSIGYQMRLDASLFASWTFAFDGDIFDYEALRYSYNSPAAGTAMNYLLDLYNRGCAKLTVEPFGDQTGFSQGAVLFTVGTSAGLPFYQSGVDEEAGFNWSVAPLPHIAADPIQNVYGTSLSMPKGTPESELATWLFIKYFTQPDVQSQWVLASAYLPVRISTAQGLTEVFAADPSYEAAFKLLPYASTEPSVPGYDLVRDMVAEAMAAILAGEDVQETLDQLNQDANLNLAERIP